MMLYTGALVTLVSGVAFLLDACTQVARRDGGGMRLLAAAILLAFFACFYAAMVWEGKP